MESREALLLLVVYVAAFQRPATGKSEHCLRGRRRSSCRLSTTMTCTYIIAVELKCIKSPPVVKGGLAMVVGVPIENLSGLNKFGPNKYFIISPKLDQIICFSGANFYSQSTPAPDIII